MAVINRCDLNSNTAHEFLGFLAVKGYLSLVMEWENNRYVSTAAAAEYTALFSSLYQKLFDERPGFLL